MGMQRQREGFRVSLVLHGDGLCVPVEGRALRVAPGALVRVFQRLQTLRRDRAAALPPDLPAEVEQATAAPVLGAYVTATNVLGAMPVVRVVHAVTRLQPLNLGDVRWVRLLAGLLPHLQAAPFLNCL